MMAGPEGPDRPSGAEPSPDDEGAGHQEDHEASTEGQAKPGDTAGSEGGTEDRSSAGQTLRSDEREHPSSGTKRTNRVRLRPLLAGASGGLAFVLLAALPMPARIWAAVLLVPLPALLSGQHLLIGDPTELPRIPVYSSSIISLWVMAFLTALATRASGFTAASVGVAGVGPVAGVLWAVAATAVGMGVVFAAHALDIGATDLVEALIPRNREEKGVFAGLSCTAGICEELVFRGFLIHVITLASGSLALALVVSTLVFGWMHTYQGAQGAAGAGLLGAILAVPLIITGSLFPSMVAHAAIDILTGIVFAPRLYDQVA